MSEAADCGSKALKILSEHSLGKEKPSVISFFTQLTSLKKDSNESVTDNVHKDINHFNSPEKFQML